MNKKTSLVLVTSFTATFVAICAAIFSVTGIAKLFAGAAMSAAIMASALELGKIVSISFLYQYWTEIPKTLKSYLSIASVVLMLVTSAGIYGYLSSAYAKVAATPLQLNADIEATTGQIQSVEQDIQRKNDRLNQLISLRVQQETRLDNMVSRSTTGSNSTIRNAQTALNQADRNVVSLQNEITKLAAKKDSLKGLSISKRVEIETNGDIGTFVYIAKILNTDLDTVVKWFTLIIVLVFDPLAIALVIAVNFLIKNKNTEDQNMQEELISPIIKVSDEGFDKIVEMIDNPSEPTEALKKLMQEEEPYQVYVTPPEPEKPPVVQPKDGQYYARGDFDWSKKELWEDNPAAVQYYNTYIKNRT